ncbi:MAG: hypothetical protein AAF587_41600 [Bacteroidota bacterium]
MSSKTKLLALWNNFLQERDPELFEEVYHSTRPIIFLNAYQYFFNTQHDALDSKNLAKEATNAVFEQIQLTQNHFDSLSELNHCLYRTTLEICKKMQQTSNTS